MAHVVSLSYADEMVLQSHVGRAGRGSSDPNESAIAVFLVNLFSEVRVHWRLAFKPPKIKSKDIFQQPRKCIF